MNRPRTFKEVEAQDGHSIHKLYSWLYRGQLEEKGYKHVKIGSVNLLKKVKTKK